MQRNEENYEIPTLEMLKAWIAGEEAYEASDLPDLVEADIRRIKEIAKKTRN